MHIIGLTGPARSGKDTSAKYLQEISQNSYTISSFATPIKNMLNVIGIDTSDESKDKLDLYYGCTPRYMMQTLGTEWGRNKIHTDIWLKAFIKLNQGKNIIIPDVRFINESKFVRQHGLLIHLKNRGGINSNNNSENGLIINDRDFVIDNSGTIKELHNKLYEIYINRFK